MTLLEKLNQLLQEDQELTIQLKNKREEIEAQRELIHFENKKADWLKRLNENNASQDLIERAKSWELPQTDAERMESQKLVNEMSQTIEN